MPIATGRALLDPYPSLKKAGLGSDMVFADLGAGMLGHFVFPASDIVGPNGRVYAVDILKTALESIEGRARLEAAPNVLTLWGDIERERGVDLPSAKADVVALVGVADVVQKSPQVLVEVKRLLKSGGRLLFIDWKPEAGSLVVKAQDRVPAEDALRTAQAAGFVLSEQFDAGSQHWGFVLQKA